MTAIGLAVLWLALAAFGGVAIYRQVRAQLAWRRSLADLENKATAVVGKLERTLELLGEDGSSTVNRGVLGYDIRASCDWGNYCRHGLSGHWGVSEQLVRELPPWRHPFESTGYLVVTGFNLPEGAAEILEGQLRQRLAPEAGRARNRTLEWREEAERERWGYWQHGVFDPEVSEHC